MKKLLACLFALALAMPFVGGTASGAPCDDNIKKIEASLASMGDSPAKVEIEAVLQLAYELAQFRAGEGDLMACEGVTKDIEDMIAKVQKGTRQG